MTSDDTLASNLTISKDSNLPVELHDGVFNVLQVTRATNLEHRVGADLVTVYPGSQSHSHRHNKAETVLFITGGSGEILLNETGDPVPVSKGDRIIIRAGQYHAVKTLEDTLEFLSVQSPPILDASTGQLDLEWLISLDSSGC